MRKVIIILLVLLFSIPLFSQQVEPPHKGLTLIYDDTLGIGYRGAMYSYGGAAGDSMYFGDTTALVAVKHLWGGATLYFDFDWQGSGDADSLQLGMIGYNPEVGELVPMMNQTTIYAPIDTISRSHVNDGQCYLNLSADGNTTYWGKHEYVAFYISGIDTVRIRIWLLAD